jgi:hypothetical protein
MVAACGRGDRSSGEPKRYADEFHGGTTGGIQEAINALGDRPGTVVLGARTYAVTTPIVIKHHRQNIIGAGKWATEIDFRPASPGALFTFDAGGGVLYQNAIGGLGISGLDERPETAVRAIDTSELYIHDLAIQNWHGVGLELRGRELLVAERLSIHTDRPISIAADPNAPIMLDAYAIRDAYLMPTAPAEACIHVEGVAKNTVIQHWRMDGIDCVGGQYGVFLDDPIGVASFLDWDWRNMHWEQQTGAGGYFLYLNRTQGTIQNATLTNLDAGAGDNTSNGFFLRNTLKLTATNLVSQGSHNTALDADATNRDLVLVNPDFQVGSRVRNEAGASR